MNRKNNASKYGPNVGRDGGNPDYKKTVIQLENERIERERQVLLMKRKRNSNYIQQCIKNGNEQYNYERLMSLNWLRKDNNNEILDSCGNIDQKNIIAWKKKQEIQAKYTMIAKESRFNDDGYYRYILTKGNNSDLVRRVINSRPYWV